MCLGVPGKIIETYDNNGLHMGKVDFGGVVRETCLEYVPEAAVGDYTIIHVGFAISLLSEDEANETLELLRQMVDLDDELGPEPDGSAAVAPRDTAAVAPGDTAAIAPGDTAAVAPGDTAAIAPGDATPTQS